MGFCEKKECVPTTCHVPCPTGKELINLFNRSKCGENCAWIKNKEPKINGTNLCKDASCVIGDAIIIFRGKPTLEKH